MCYKSLVRLRANNNNYLLEITSFDGDIFYLSEVHIAIQMCQFLLKLKKERSC